MGLRERLCGQLIEPGYKITTATKIVIDAFSTECIDYNQSYLLADLTGIPGLSDYSEATKRALIGDLKELAKEGVTVEILYRMSEDNSVLCRTQSGLKVWVNGKVLEEVED